MALPFRKLIVLSVVVIYVCVAVSRVGWRFTSPPQVFAGISDTGVDTANGETLATNPKSRTASVSASVRDTIPPAVPILVSPDNGSSSNVNTVTFIWKSSSDAYGIAKYQLYFDGSLLFDNISPPAKIQPNAYEYSEHDILSNLLMKYTFADGSHTWKVRAYDTNDNYADSATWSFTIDTDAPILLISQIGDEVVSISAQDSSTIPTDAIVLYANTPTISGKTEVNATIKLNYTIPPGYSDAGAHALSTSADSSGNYSFTLPSLPLHAVIVFQIISQDSVGNTSIIDNVPFKILRKTIVIPAIITEIIPTVPPEITVVSPEELRQKVKTFVPEPVVEIVDTVTPYSNSAIGLAIPLVRLLAALSLLGIPIWNWSLRTLLTTAHSVGLWPFWWLPPLPHHAHGIVFNLDTQKPIPFALITVLRIDSEGPIAIEQRVSDKDGTYETMRFPASGSYILVPKHRDYRFDPAIVAKRFSAMREVYKGETITKDACEIDAGDVGNAGGAGATGNASTVGSTDTVGIASVASVAGAASSAGGNFANQVGHSHTSDHDDGIECAGGEIFAHPYVPMIEVKRERSERWATVAAILPDNGLSFCTAAMAVIAFLSPTPWNIAVFVIYAISLTRRVFFA